MLCLLRRARIAASHPPPILCPSRLLTTTPLVLQTSMPSRPKPPPDCDLEESYLKGSGPGGQKIVSAPCSRSKTNSNPPPRQNKTNSAVQLKHIPTGIVVKSQATRSRAQNRKHAREILAQRLDDLQHGAQSRAGIVGAVKKKRADSAAKKSRRKYKKLQEDTGAATAQQGEQIGTGTGEEAARQEAVAAPRDGAGDAAEQSSQSGAGKTSVEDTGDSPQTSSSTSPSQSIDPATRQ